jgi:NitT/TauT family transport system substrate-binding protein
MSPSRWNRARVVTAALALVLGTSPVTAEEVVRIGDLPQLSTAALYVAMDKGYFTEAGLRLDPQSFASAGKMTPALATGELDVATGAPSAGLFNAIASGVNVRIVADKGQVRPGYSGTLLTVRKDLVDSGQVKSLKDLKGRTISTGAKAITTEYFLAKMFEDAGVPYDAVKITYLSYPDGVKALAGKAIDGFWGPEPWGARAEEQKVGVRFALPEQVKSIATFQVGVIIFGGKFIAERPQVARAFLAAYVKGAKYYNDKGPKDDEIVAILAKHTKVPAETIKASHPFWIAPDGRPRGEDFLALQDFMLTQGWIKSKLPLDRIMDLSLLPRS